MSGQIQSNFRGFRLDWILCLILLGSLVVRVALAANGGQGFFPDEYRYESTVKAVDLFLKGERRQAFDNTFSRADHLGFRVVMTLPAYFQLKWHVSLGVMVVFVSGIFSVISIGLTYGIARRLGGSQEAARWAALLLGVTNCLFYWSRHLMPYDFAMALALGGLFVGLHPAGRWHSSLVAGLLGFCAFVTYNGYWLLVGIALVIHVLWSWPSWLAMARRAILGLIGLVAPMYALIWWSVLRDKPLLEAYLAFSSSINQGDFDDGHRMIAEYLWHSERGLLLVWLATAGWFGLLVTRRRAAGAAQAWVGLLGAVTVCLALVYFSVIAEKFVVYGRLVRQIAPFSALLGGWVLADCCRNWSHMKPMRPVLVALLLGLGAFNFSQPLAQDWHFYERARAYRARYGTDPGGQPVSPDRLQIVMQSFIWPVPQNFNLPPHEVLMLGDHVLRFQPMLYEGYNREQRTVIRATDIRNRLILVRPEASPR